MEILIMIIDSIPKDDIEKNDVIAFMLGMAENDVFSI
jgi:hypothetical protein